MLTEPPVSASYGSHRRKGLPLLSYLLSFLSCFAAVSIARAQDPQVPPAGPTAVPAGDVNLQSTETPDDISIRIPKIRAALDLFTSRDFQGAEDKLKEACAENKELPPAGIIVGSWYSKANIPQAARAAFERAVRDSPGDPEAYVVFGENSIQQRRFTDAYLLYEKAMEVIKTYAHNPERKMNLELRAHQGIAAVQEAREEWVEAEGSLRKALVMSKDNIIIMSRLARVLFKQEKEQESYDIFKQMYKIDPEKTGRYEVLMAMLYQQEGKEANAEKLIGIAVREDAENAKTQLAAATWALETGRDDMSKKAIAEAIRLDPENVQVRLVEGIIARKNGENAAAESAFKAAMVVAPSNPAVLNQLAISLAAQEEKEKREKAFEFVQMAAKLAGADNEAVNREIAVTAAWILMRNDRNDDAMKQLQVALQSGGVSGDAAFFAADILHRNGKSDMAVQVLENAIENSQTVFPLREEAVKLLSTIRGK